MCKAGQKRKGGKGRRVQTTKDWAGEFKKAQGWHRRGLCAVKLIYSKILPAAAAFTCRIAHLSHNLHPVHMFLPQEKPAEETKEKEKEKKSDEDSVDEEIARLTASVATKRKEVPDETQRVISALIEQIHQTQRGVFCFLFHPLVFC